jgi:putative hemolysin
MTGTEVTYLVLFLICLVLSAFFSSSEIAFINLQKLRLKHLEESGVPHANRVAKIMERPERFLSVVLTSVSLTETVLVTCGSFLFVSLLGDTAGTPVGIIVVAIILLLLVKVIPKTIAAHNPERLALAYAAPIEVTSKVVSPVVYVLSWITDKIAGPFGGHTLPGALLGKEELETAISVGEETGVVDEASATMLKRAVKFGDRQVQEVMTPRTDAVWIEEGCTLAKFQEIYAESPMLRYPVYEGSADNVVGTLSVKQVHVALAKGTLRPDSVLTEFVRPVYFVPRTKLVGELFNEMRAKGFLMAVVLSEYGGTSGIVTMEELVEEIVGEVREELVGAGQQFEVVSEHAYQIEGSMRIDEANESPGLGIPQGDYDTVAGFALHVFGHLPEEGDQITHGHLRLAVTEVTGSRIARLLVTKEQLPPEEAEEQPDDPEPGSEQAGG